MKAQILPTAYTLTVNAPLYNLIISASDLREENLHMLFGGLKNLKKKRNKAWSKDQIWNMETNIQIEKIKIVPSVSKTKN